jgi:tellurite resistance-related uncharacterized protein
MTVDRRITNLHADDAGDWVAELDCGHSRHVRHEPPLTERAWVTRESERDARIGTPLACGRCARRELPSHFTAHRRTPSFDADSVPDALRERHATKAGVWGRIHVESGRLALRTFAPFDDETILTPDSPGTVLPEVEHAVTPLGPVRFHVEFWRAPDSNR